MPEVFSWTEERTEQLKKMWAEGLTGRQIANYLGGISRNSVIGKVHRLKLPERQAGNPRAVGVSRRFNRSRNPGASATITTPREKKYRTFGNPLIQEIVSRARPVVDEFVIPIGERKKLIDLEPGDCCSPIGDPKADDFHFCGRPRVIGLPYCTHHTQRNYNVTEKRVIIQNYLRNTSRPAFVDWTLDQLPVKDNSKEFTS